MTNRNYPTKTWINPRWATTPEWARPVIQSLEQFLARPEFFNGIGVGDGSAPTKNSEGVTTKPPLTRIDKTAIVSIEDSLAGLGTSVGEVYSDLASMQADLDSLETAPISGTRITDGSISTPKLAANSITADKLAVNRLASSQWIASTEWIDGVSGWIINANGNAQFNSDVTVKGTVVSNNFKTQGVGAQVRVGTGAGTDGTDEIQFIGASGQVGSIRNGQFALGHATSMRLSAGGIIDLFYDAFLGNSRINLTAGLGVNVSHELRAATLRSSGSIIALGDFFNGSAVGGSGGVYTNYVGVVGNVSCAVVQANGGAITGGLTAGSLNLAGSAVTRGLSNLVTPFVTFHNTTGSGANAFLNSISGELLRSTSSQRFKADVLDLTQDHDTSVILGVTAKTWLSRLTDADLGGGDSPTDRFAGLIAEHVAAADPILATYGEDELAESINWPAVTAFLLEEVKRLRVDVDALHGTPGPVE